MYSADDCIGKQAAIKNFDAARGLGNPSILANAEIDRITMFTVLGRLFDDARHLADRVEALADSLAGSQGVEGKAVDIPSAGGLLGMVEADAEKIRVRIGQAFDALDRIERRLP